MPQPDFTRKVLAVVRAIPKGRVLTYRQVAEKAGHPRAYRAVGNLMNKNRDREIPCHRVVRSDGSPGGYAWGNRKKIARLRAENAQGLKEGALDADPVS